MLPTLVLVCGSLVARAVMTVLAKKQTVVMNVAYLSSSMKAPRYKDNDDSVAKKQTEAMNVARLSSSMRVPGCQDKDERFGSRQ